MSMCAVFVHGRQSNFLSIIDNSMNHFLHEQMDALISTIDNFLDNIFFALTLNKKFTD